jgi:putative oxidoreductase
MILNRSTDFLGRVLISALFLLAALNKFVNTPAVLHHMAVQHVPDYFLPLVIALEICAGLAILIGWQVRWAALALAGFCVATAVLFHMDFTQAVERTMFTKDLAIAGGLLILASSRFAVPK